MTTFDEPELDAPGAGLPKLELLIARKLFAKKCSKGCPSSFVASFEEERLKIRKLIHSSEKALRNKRLLIPRLRGLEDSSRYWSIWMTLDHLRITNTAFAHVITELVAGRVPEIVARTADVKPDPSVTAAVEAEYEQSCENFLGVVAASPNLETSKQYAHPWFGSLDAFEWLSLADSHMGLHRAQISKIINLYR